MTATTELGDRRRQLEHLLRERLAQAGAVPKEPHPFGTRVNPPLARVLSGMGLDKKYVRGQDCWLYDEQGRRFLDFTAAYGALPFGHTPDEIWDAVASVRTAAEPIFVQPSIQDAAGQLAAELARISPGTLNRVTFANSGAEAVEVSLKLARSATGRLGVLTTDNAFHGKTLGALSATGRTQYQQEFGAPAQGFHRIPFGDAEALERELSARPDHYAAFMIEPIQGEGGINVAPPGYLAAVRTVCDRHGVLLILDEVQTGLGRTGRLFACQHDEVVPDIIALAKALGGGVVPIAAVLCRDELATEGFAMRHSSTFAGNALGSRVGLRVIDMLTRDDQAVVRAVAEQGEKLRRDLVALAGRFPQLVKQVRGRGFLMGVELTDDPEAVGGQGLLGSMAAQETLGMVLCSYLLNVEHVRVAPTLFGAKVLRVEPPLIAGDAEREFFIAALDRAFALLAAGDLVGLVGHLVGGADTDPIPSRRARVVRPTATDRRFAFVAHPVQAASFLDFDPALRAFSAPQLGDLMTRFDSASSVLNPAAMVIGGGRVHSETGVSAYGELIGIPYTAQQLLELPTEKAVSVVREAVCLGRDRGAEIVGLGAFTSIVTGNAEYLGDLGVSLTTGNGFTVASGIEGIRRAAAERGLDIGTATVAVVGAAGSIGSAAAAILAGEFGRLMLVGNPRHPEVTRRRLTGVAAGLVGRFTGESGPAEGGFAAAVRASAGARDGDLEKAVQDLIDADVLRLVTDPAELLEADAVLAATSTPEPIITAAVLRPDAIVCDLAQPSNVPDEVLVDRPDVRLFDGGIVELPGRAAFGVDFGLPDGLTYACMAETMLLSLDADPGPASIGDRLRVDNIVRLQQAARRHGFDLAPLTTWRADLHHVTAGV